MVIWVFCIYTYSNLKTCKKYIIRQENGYKQQYWILHNILCTVHNLYLFMKLIVQFCRWWSRGSVLFQKSGIISEWMKNEFCMKRKRGMNAHISPILCRLFWKNCVMITITFCFCYKYFFHNHKHVNCQVLGKHDWRTSV